MKDEERGGTTESERLKEWIIMAFPVMARAFSIVIQEHRLDEIPGCRGILESCPVKIPDEMPDGWEEAEKPLRGWIPVDDRLPEWGELVLVFHPAYFGRSRIKIAYIEQIDKRGHGWGFMDGGDLHYGVTHWRPLPCEPEMKEDK